MEAVTATWGGRLLLLHATDGLSRGLPRIAWVVDFFQSNLCYKGNFHNFTLLIGLVVTNANWQWQVEARKSLIRETEKFQHESLAVNVVV
jgi:hypothetical protein